MRFRDSKIIQKEEKKTGQKTDLYPKKAKVAKQFKLGKRAAATELKAQENLSAQSQDFEVPGALAKMQPMPPA
jgi:hypothetical protein